MVFAVERSFQMVQKYDSSLVQECSNRVQENAKKQAEYHSLASLQLKEPISCRSFQTIMDCPYYIQILQQHLLCDSRKQLG